MSESRSEKKITALRLFSYKLSILEFKVFNFHAINQNYQEMNHGTLTVHYDSPERLPFHFWAQFFK